MNIHHKKPIRRPLDARPNYIDYRDDLRIDFNGSCGYCDDSDDRVDRIAFHIDHFAPKKRFPGLAKAYENLVYACRFCNMHKSNKWVGDDSARHNDGAAGFVDPCSDDYEAHLERRVDGRIVGITDLGIFIVKELKLDLIRHELLWRARRARALRNEIDPLIERYQRAGLPKADVYVSLLERAHQLTLELELYELKAVHA